METQRYTLSWNQFQSNLNNGFQSLLRDQELVDVTIAVGGRYIKAHKIILSICSPYFNELFNANPCKHPIVVLQDMNFEIFQSMLVFMYHGETNVSQSELAAFLKVAEVLQIKGLSDYGTQAMEDTGPKTEEIKDEISSMNEFAHPKKRPRQMRRLNMDATMKQCQCKEKKAKFSTSSMSDLSKTDAPTGVDQFTAQSPEMNNSHSNDNVDIIDMSRLVSSEIDNKLAKEVPKLDGTTNTMVIKSRKGLPVLIHAGHMYTNCAIDNGNETKDNPIATSTSSSTNNDRIEWHCVKKRPLKCDGCITTNKSFVILSYSGHNHTQLNDIIQRVHAAHNSCKALNLTTSNNSSNNSSPSHSSSST